MVEKSQHDLRISSGLDDGKFATLLHVHRKTRDGAVRAEGKLNKALQLEGKSALTNRLGKTIKTDRRHFVPELSLEGSLRGRKKMQRMRLPGSPRLAVMLARGLPLALFNLTSCVE